jgi:hypothetical protein
MRRYPPYFALWPESEIIQPFALCLNREIASDPKNEKAATVDADRNGSRGIGRAPCSCTEQGSPPEGSGIIAVVPFHCLPDKPRQHRY